jgi:hypothetical protein
MVFASAELAPKLLRHRSQFAFQAFSPNLNAMSPAAENAKLLATLILMFVHLHRCCIDCALRKTLEGTENGGGIDEVRFICTRVAAPADLSLLV